MEQLGRCCSPARVCGPQELLAPPPGSLPRLSEQTQHHVEPSTHQLRESSLWLKEGMLCYLFLTPPQREELEHACTLEGLCTHGCAPSSTEWGHLRHPWRRHGDLPLPVLFSALFLSLDPLLSWCPHTPYHLVKKKIPPTSSWTPFLLPCEPECSRTSKTSRAEVTPTPGPPGAPPPASAVRWCLLWHSAKPRHPRLPQAPLVRRAFTSEFTSNSSGHGGSVFPDPQGKCANSEIPSSF